MKEWTDFSNELVAGFWHTQLTEEKNSCICRCALVVGLELEEFVDLGFRIVEDSVMGFWQESKGGLMNYFYGYLVKERTWDFTVLKGK